MTNLLLTGEAILRTTAEQEGLEVHGMLWLMDEMFNKDLIDFPGAKKAYAAMKQDGSRLPWDKVDRQLRRYSR